MAEHNDIGKLGEEIAQDYLRKKGYKLIALNWRSFKDELDIIGSYKEQLVIVEVKTRTSTVFENPKEAVTLKKQKHIIRAADAFIQENEIEMECRFDIISVLILDNEVEVEHIQDAFYPLL